MAHKPRTTLSDLRRPRPAGRGFPPRTLGVGVGPVVAPRSGFKSNISTAVAISREAVDNAAQQVNFKQREQVAAMTMELIDTLPPLMVTHTKLYPMSHDELEKLSVCDVKVPSIAGRSTCNDKRLGVIDDHELCATCHQTNSDDIGHLGRIVLHRPYLNPIFGVQAVLVLQCVCNSCSSLLLDRASMKADGLDLIRDTTTRLQRIAAAAVKIGKCPNSAQRVADGYEPCFRNPVYTPNSMKSTWTVTYTYDKDKASTKTPPERSIDEIDEIFRGISEEDKRLLGFDGSDPVNLILKSFPVVPPTARPYAIQDGEIKHDFLTTSYCDIVRYNNKYSQRIPTTDPDAENKKYNHERNLYFFLSHFQNNSTDHSYTRGSDEPVLSVWERLIQKDGYIRGNAMGKRNDYTGRSVAGSNNKLRFGQVQYPRRMQSVTTYEEKVTSRNIARITKLYNDGRIVALTPGTGEFRGRKFLINDQTRLRRQPRVGDKVERYAEDGDPNLVNRQPTLHKQSTIGNNAVYGEDDTIKIRSEMTTPMNADFDGDELNKHKIRTIQGQAEALWLCNALNCIPNAQANRPMMGMVYNAVSAIYMMTQPDVQLSQDEWDEATALLLDQTYIVGDPQRGWHSLEDRLNKVGVPARSGRALMATVLPPDFYYDHGGVKIRYGVPLDMMTKKHVGPVANSIIHYLWKIHTKDQVEKFFTECQWISDWFLEAWGLSIGIDDCIAPNEEKVNEIISRELISVQLKLDSMAPETSDMTPGEKDYRSREVISALDKVSSIGNKISLKALSENNPLNIMSKSGAKGNDSNTAQITGLLGQQFIKGKLPLKSLTNNQRCLPYFEPNTSDIQAYGFILENFMVGMRPAGAFFHLQASRVGLIDTAVSTALVGATNHQLVKVSEDITAWYDGSVRGANGALFQYVFSDGFDSGNMINSYAPATGNVVSFMDVRHAINMLNYQWCGYGS